MSSAERGKGAAGLAAVWLAVPGGVLEADDDDSPVLPVDPGLGFEGILPDPPLTPYLIPDQTTFAEYLRDGYPAGGGRPGAFQPTDRRIRQFDGADHLAVTFATPARLVYAPGSGGSLVAVVDGVARDRFEASTDLHAEPLAELALVEVVPALASGLPSLALPLPEIPAERPGTELPRAFVTNRVVVADEN